MNDKTNIRFINAHATHNLHFILKPYLGMFDFYQDHKNLCPHVLLLDQVTFSTTEAFTPWMCDEEPFPRLVLFV